MTSLLYGNCVQLKEQSGQCRLSSGRRPPSLLPNRERHAVSSAPHNSSSHSASRPAVQEPSVYYEVFTRPVVLSHRHRRVTTSVARHTVDRCLALQSLSDSNIVASAKSRAPRRTNRLKPELSTNDAKLYRNICLPSVVDRVTSQNCDGAVTSNVPLSHEAACYQGDRQCTNEEWGKIGSREETKSATIIRRNSNAGSLTHIPSDTTGHSESGHNDTAYTGHSQSKTSVGRLVHVNGSQPHVCTRDNDEAFLEKKTKFYNQLQKTRNGRTSSGIRHRKMAHSTGTGGTDKLQTAELCLVGQSFIRVTERKRSHADDNSMQNKNTISIPTSADCGSEVNGLSQQRKRQTQVHCLPVVADRYRSEYGDHQHRDAAAAAAAADDDDDDDDDDDPMANSNEENSLFQSCVVDVPEDCSPGKIPV